MLSTTECSSSYLSSNDDSNENEITNESCNAFSKHNKLSRFFEIIKFVYYSYWHFILILLQILFI